MRQLSTLLPLTLLLSATALAVSPAQAQGTTPFTITEYVDFTGEGPNTFEATGPLCASGTFVDDVQVAAAANDHGQGIDHSGGVNLVIRTVYTCDDGSGTFDALKHVLITFTEDGATNTGPIQLLGGTGDYAGLVGHGVDQGTASGDTGLGEIEGFVVTG